MDDDDSSVQSDIDICNDDYVRGVEDEVVHLRFSKKVQNKMNERMKNTLVIRVLGRSIGYKTLFNRMHILWNPKKHMKVMDVDNCYYMVRFASHDDYTKVLLQGQWKVLGHYLTVQLWTPCFDPKGNNLYVIATWARFPGLRKIALVIIPCNF
ncbi:hypothetical protein Scep_001328 [Stephania cephalantha]|uniref:DUF4283 domain-containing protein n=1 Tax=Stephania cephalantha TaxID=152367 RepID=A0AAP0L7P5_9MAGN